MKISKDVFDEFNQRNDRIKKNIEDVFVLNEDVTKKVLCKDSDDLKKLKLQLLHLDGKAIEYIRDFSQSGFEPEKILQISENGNFEELVDEAKLKIKLRETFDDLLYIFSLRTTLRENYKGKDELQSIE